MVGRITGGADEVRLIKDKAYCLWKEPLIVTKRATRNKGTHGNRKFVKGRNAFPNIRKCNVLWCGDDHSAYPAEGKSRVSKPQHVNKKKQKQDAWKKNDRTVNIDKLS